MEPTSTFLDAWNNYMFYSTLVCVVIGALIFLYYEFNVLRIKEYKSKYDYVNLHEIKYFWYAVIAFLIAGVFMVNTIGSKLIIDHGSRWFFVRGFIGASFLVVGYFIFHSLIRIYYPKKLSKRLYILRNKPRISPEGNTMRKLSES